MSLISSIEHAENDGRSHDPDDTPWLYTGLRKSYDAPAGQFSNYPFEC